MKRFALLPCLLAALAVPSRAQDLKDLERKIDALSQEVEQLKLGAASPAGSRLADKLSLGGYGEMDAQIFSRRSQKGDAAAKRSSSDAERFVLTAEYRFNDSILLKSELEVEHGGTGEGGETRGEAGVEQAYLDFRQWDILNFRAGHVLLPVGLINETHEPPTYHGVRRPSVETVIIPTTWHENGVGIFGGAGPVSYRSYMVAGFQAVQGAGGPTVDGFTGSAGIRGGRTEGSRSPIEDLAWVGRLDLKPAPGAVLGASLYIGEADHHLTAAAVPVTLWEVHGAGEYRGAELRALYAQSTVGNADAVNAAQVARNAGFTDFVGRRQFGGYVEAAFNAFSLCPKTDKYLAPFFRYERTDTQSHVPRGFVNNAANSRVEYTLGLTFKPIPKIALKTDYQWLRNQARTGVNQWNLGMGFMF